MDAHTYMATVSRLEHYEQLARQMAKKQRPEKGRQKVRIKAQLTIMEGNVRLVPAAKNA